MDVHVAVGPLATAARVLTSLSAVAAVVWFVAVVSLALRLRSGQGQSRSEHTGRVTRLPGASLAAVVVTVVRRTTWLQVALLAVVLLLAGGLVLPRSPEAFEVVVSLADDVDALVTVDPAVEDRATVHLYLLDPTGRPTQRAESLELAVRAGGSDDAVRVEPFPAGPGHWIASVDAVAEPGTWQLELIAHLDDGGTARARITPDAG